VNEPYRGLQPYRAEDGDYFVGREKESAALAANALTAPITVFLGASGVGKSSVLFAGVMPILERERSAIPVIFRDWHDVNFRETIQQRIIAAAVARPKSEATLILIFDQFEEYFLYNPDPNSRFDAELALAINNQRIDLNVVFSMRDDSLAALGRLQKRIPSILQNCIRIDHLDRAAAKNAIEKPLLKWAELRHETPMPIEPALVETILSELDARRWPGGGEIADSATRSQSLIRRVATPYLQIVMTRLWNDARVKRTGMSVAQLSALGGTATIVKNHVDGVMESLTAPERRLCARLFDRLATPSGKKIACFESDLRVWAGDLVSHLSGLLQILSDPDRRFLRRIESSETTQYELYHDVLSHSVTSWSNRFRDREAKLEAERERTRAYELLEAKRRARILGGWLTTVALGVIVFGIGAWRYYVLRSERENAENLVTSYALQQLATTTAAPVQAPIVEPPTDTTATVAVNEDAEKARAALDHANRLLVQKEFKSAAAVFENAAFRFHALNDRGHEAAAQAGLAVAYRESGAISQATDAFDNEINLYEQLGEQHTLAEAYFQYGLFNHDLGRNDDALPLYAKAAELFQKLRDNKRLGAVLAQQGYALMQKGDFAGGIKTLESAAELQEQIGDLPGVAATYTLLATAYRRSSNQKAADKYYRMVREAQRRQAAAAAKP